MTGSRTNRETTRCTSALASILFASLITVAQRAPELRLNDQEYFAMPGLDVMAFQDIYPEGHQAGVSIIQNGVRVATNGDLRLDVTPGQWQPMPKQDRRAVDPATDVITTWLSYPDPSRNRTGFNPIDYPDLNLSYQVRVRGEGKNVRVTVDLDQPLPAQFVGKIGFNLELYPAALFGKSWYLGNQSGIFPRQPGGPDLKSQGGDVEPAPLAAGPRLSVAPESDAQRMIIESRAADLSLFDGRNKHNNGWFVVRSLVPAGATRNAVDWIITANALPGWKYTPVVHVSQVGYHPAQKKVAIIELDNSDEEISKFESVERRAARSDLVEGSSPVVHDVSVTRIAEDGTRHKALSGTPKTWGKFLRYQYLQFDFSSVQAPGMYEVDYGGSHSQVFRIAPDVYQRGVWQPVLEYFLPVQMCHMRVEEQYRVWHGACHLDDARMAPTNYTHFDGYLQGPDTLNRFHSGETVAGMNVGGWHDAGDDDLRIESQTDEVSILARAYEAFGLDYDDTTIDESERVAKIHQPDGKPDALQQVEHGILTVLGSYRTMGRFYRGIITPTLHQYTMLGDESNSTDNLFYDSSLRPGERTATHSGRPDDRLLFTEQNAAHEYKGIAALAACGRVLKKYNPPLAEECTQAAQSLWSQPRSDDKAFNEKIVAAVELLLTTGKPTYRQFLLDQRIRIVANIDGTGWAVGRVIKQLNDPTFTDDIRRAVARNFSDTVAKQAATPFAVPYEPYIWGAGWEIQEFGVQQYFLHRAFPDIVSDEYLLNALNFILGVHPGENTASFASGVGARSMTIAYGFNRADWSYIPGGVSSGTALIRPDFPELKDFPYLWQQGEYVLGGGSSNYMFLVLAADQILNGK